MIAYQRQVIGCEITLWDLNEVANSEKEAVWSKKIKWEGLGCAAVALTETGVIYSMYDESQLPGLIEENYWITNKNSGVWDSTFIDNILVWAFNMLKVDNTSNNKTIKSKTKIKTGKLIMLNVISKIIFVQC